jgi:hypothetical protein
VYFPTPYSLEALDLVGLFLLLSFLGCFKFGINSIRDYVNMLVPIAVFKLLATLPY